MPGMPSTLSHCVSVPRRRSILTSSPRAICLPAKRAYSCTPSAPLTRSPTANAGILRGDDDADAAGAHHLVDGDRRDVALALVHPAAHRRVERERERLDEHAAGVGLRDRLGGEAPVGAHRQADRAAGEADLVVGRAASVLMVCLLDGATILGASVRRESHAGDGHKKTAANRGFFPEQSPSREARIRRGRECSRPAGPSGLA